MRLRALATGTVLALGVTILIAEPASAADARLRIDRPATNVDPDARTTWDDSNNNLCTKVFTSGRWGNPYALAAIRRPNTGEWVRVIDTYADAGGRCTGHLSIKENRRTRMRLCHYYDGPGPIKKCKRRYVRT